MYCILHSFPVTDQSEPSIQHSCTVTGKNVLWTSWARKVKLFETILPLLWIPIHQKDNTVKRAGPPAALMHLPSLSILVSLSHSNSSQCKTVLSCQLSSYRPTLNFFILFPLCGIFHHLSLSLKAGPHSSVLVHQPSSLTQQILPLSNCFLLQSQTWV